MYQNHIVGLSLYVRRKGLLGPTTGSTSLSSVALRSEDKEKVMKRPCRGLCTVQVLLRKDEESKKTQPVQTEMNRTKGNLDIQDVDSFKS